MRITRLTDKQLELIAESETADDAGMSNVLTEYVPKGVCNTLEPVTKEVGISKFVWSQLRVMAMEILEYRRTHGDLGCEWLEC